MDPLRVSRIFDVLEYLVTHPEGMALKQISNDLNLPISSAHDLLKAMTHNELLLMDDRRHYTLGPRVVRMSFSVARSVNVEQVSRRHLKRLVDEIGEDVYLATQVGHSVVYVEQFYGPQPVNVSVRLMQPRPLHSTAAGKLFSAFNPELRDLLLKSESLESFTKNTLTDRSRLLAQFKEIRKRELSISDEESIEGIVALSTPIYGPHGRVIAAVHVSTLRRRMSPERIPEIAIRMKKTGEVITKEFGGSRSPESSGVQAKVPFSVPTPQANQ